MKFSIYKNVSHKIKFEKKANPRMYHLDYNKRLDTISRKYNRCPSNETLFYRPLAWPLGHFSLTLVYLTLLAQVS